MQDKKSEIQAYKTKIAVAIVCFLVGIAAMCANLFYFNPTYDKYTVDIKNLSSLANQIMQVKDEDKSYEQQIDDSGKSYNNLLTSKDEYTSYLGNITTANSLNINKMTVEDIQSRDDGLYSMKIQIELQGHLVNVKDFVQEFYDSPMVGRINKFSYRLQNDADLQWMWRSVDDENLVSWWTLQENTSSDDEHEIKQVTADDLMKHGTALCYLEVEFIGTGA